MGEYTGHVSFYNDDGLVASILIEMQNPEASREEIKERIQSEIQRYYKNFKELETENKIKSHGLKLIENVCEQANKMCVEMKTECGTRYLKWKIKT